MTRRESSDLTTKARSVDAFLSQLIRYVSSGHYFYITGRIPKRQDPAAVDAKLIALYDIAKPRWARARRRLRGTAGIHYLRHDRFFALLATHGQHQFFNADFRRGISMTISSVQVTFLIFPEFA